MSGYITQPSPLFFSFLSYTPYLTQSFLTLKPLPFLPFPPCHLSGRTSECIVAKSFVLLHLLHHFLSCFFCVVLLVVREAGSPGRSESTPFLDPLLCVSIHSLLKESESCIVTMNRGDVDKSVGCYSNACQHFFFLSRFSHLYSVIHCPKNELGNRALRMRMSKAYTVISPVQNGPILGNTDSPGACVFASLQLFRQGSRPSHNQLLQVRKRGTYGIKKSCCEIVESWFERSDS